MNQGTGRFGVFLLALCVLSGSSHGQALNVDIGDNFGGPSEQYGGAAGQPGRWNVINAVGDTGNPVSLVDLGGAPTSATIDLTAWDSSDSEELGTYEVAADHPDTTGDEALLMDDQMDCGGIFGTGIIRFAGLTPGKYDVYVYAWASDNLGSSQHNTLGQQLRGADWDGIRFLHTYAVEACRTVGDNGLLSIIVTANGYGSANGVQLVPRSGPCPFSSRCFGNGSTPGCTDCPCGNNAPNSATGGCLNSAGKSARLVPSGIPSATQDRFWVRLIDATPNSFAILASASNATPLDPANPCFGALSGVTSILFDGLRCIATNEIRHGVRATNANGGLVSSDSFEFVPMFGWGGLASPAQGLVAQGGFVSGETRHFQVIYREEVNAGCGTGLNTSQAVRALIGP